MKKFLAEFKEFALRGNVIDMSIGIIIGAAFKDIVTSLTDNFIMPILNFFTGAATYGWGDIKLFASAFVSTVIQFILIAFILFLLLKGINTLTKIGKKKEEEPAPTTKICPFCKSEISIEATRCPHCTSEITE